MQTKKMSLANIKGKLSRVEMKQIMAGSGGVCCVCSNASGTYSSCWFTSSTCDDVCGRVYGAGNGAYATTCYPGCIMN